MKTSRFLAAGVMAAGVALFSAPVGLSAPLPNPEPVPVVPIGAPEAAVGGCPAGEMVMSGNCMPEMNSNGNTPVSAPVVGATGAESSTTTSYLDPVSTVPNVNGDPCTGAFESTVCYAEGFNTAPAVEPRSIISSSP